MVANFPAWNNPCGQSCGRSPDQGARLPAGAWPMYDEARRRRGHPAGRLSGSALGCHGAGDPPASFLEVRDGREVRRARGGAARDRLRVARDRRPAGADARRARRPPRRARSRRGVRAGLPRLRAWSRGGARRAHRRPRREPGDAGGGARPHRAGGPGGPHGGPAGRRRPARVPGRRLRFRHRGPGLPLRPRRRGRAGGSRARPSPRRPPGGGRHRLGLLRVAHGRP